MISHEIKQKIILLRQKLNKENNGEPIYYSYNVKKLLDKNNIKSEVVESGGHFFVLLENKNVIDLAFNMVNVHLPFIIDKNISIVRNHLSNENFNKFEIKNSKKYSSVDILKKEYDFL